ncbi:DUF3883 domain-containing protein [Bacillus thuringiensis]|uniref:DUF3883 domain-containing protein n=1 Tax=Bacillus thuringiensis TaxID=1428 RepID=UPI001E43A79D|nr:DUF3883 domain-containing protein [Bacillus thuringiensis]MCC6082233.1 DUF3883 domain-containing protein [Bacillus thuringiensis]
MKDFIESELRKLKQNYQNLPLTIISDYKNEQEKMKDYNGRQLLEMLQNADDESESAVEKTAYIELTDTHLLIANNGNPFSRGGLESLIYSNVSPKAILQNKIGHKGTGFRSILSWAKAVYIKSKGLSVEFSGPNAIEFLKGLLQEYPSIQEKLREKTDESYPISILKTPKWKTEIGAEYNVYDTYIVVEINEESKGDIQAQMDRLELQVLLFLQYLERVILKSPERTRVIEKVNLGDGRVSISIEENGEILEEKTWNIRKRGGAYLGKNYELKMAYTDELDDDIQLLYSYFRTNVRLPFPALFHGTFELTGNRNQLIESDTNKYLLEELVQLMIDTAIEITKSDQKVSWNAMRLLTFDDNLDQDLLNMKFDERLIKKIKGNPLFPVISGKYITHEEKPVSYKNPYAKILPGEKFTHLTIHTSDERLKKLIFKDVTRYEYTPQFFFKTLSEISKDLTMEQRAECIHYLTQDYKEGLKDLENLSLLNLFVDHKGEPISGGTELFLPPGNRKIKIPDFVNIKFIHEDLYKALLKEFKVSGANTLTSQLELFNVQEYRLETVLRRTISHARELIEANKVNKKKYISELLVALFQIFLEGKEEEGFPVQLNVPLMNRYRKIIDAKKLYFGKEYDNQLMENLLGPVSKQYFIGSPKTLGLDIYEKSAVRRFLQWIGVAEFPRMTVKKVTDREYERNVLKHIPYPITLKGETFRSYEKLSREVNGSSKMYIETVEMLDEILEKAAFEDILIWLMKDPAVSQLIREGRERSNNAYFYLDLKRKSNDRRLYAQKIKAFLVWKLQTFKWIENIEKQKVDTRVCCLSRAVGPEFSPFIEVPAVYQNQEKWIQHKITIAEIENFLLKIGIGPDLRSFSSESIYNILLKLPELDPNGKVARAIYKQIIMSKPRMNEANQAYQKFMDKGKVLVRMGGEQNYFPISKAYYVEDRTFCEEIMKQFPILELDKRLGNKQVKSVLGVQPLEGLKFKLTTKPEKHGLDDRFQLDLEEFKPYIYAYRLEKDNKRFELERLKKLRVHLCTEINANFIHQMQESTFTVQNYEYISVGKGYQIYLKLERDQHYELQDLRDDFRFNEVIAEIIAGVIKVEENRKDYREMYSKKLPQREDLIRLELEDEQLYKLHQARSLLKITTDPQRIFWLAVLKAAKVKQASIDMENEASFKMSITELFHLDDTYVEKVWTTLDYEEPDSHSNAPFLIQLFKDIGIDFSDFNQFTLKQIDLKNYYRNELERLKVDFQNSFFTYLFQQLKNASIEEKECLIQERDRYMYFTDFLIENSISIDCDSIFAHFLKDEFDIEIMKLDGITKLDLNQVFNDKEKLLKEKLQTACGVREHEVEEFLEKQKIRSLLYFGEFSILVEKFTEWRKKYGERGVSGEIAATKGKGETGSTVESYSNLFGLLQQQSGSEAIKSIKPVRYESDRKGSKGRSSKSSKGTPIPSQKSLEEIGFLGEAYVYLALCNRYEKENVEWVSENAKKAKVNEHGNNSENYDIRYKDGYGKLRYVEVKSSVGTDFVFHISKQEVAFGEAMKDAYEIFFVSNVKSVEEREIRRVTKFFKYKKDESFNQNSRFSVENSSFVIRFEEE